MQYGIRDEYHLNGSDKGVLLLANQCGGGQIKTGQGCKGDLVGQWMKPRKMWCVKTWRGACGQ